MATIAATHRAIPTTAAAATFAFSYAHQTPHGEKHRRSNDKHNYDCLYHISRLAIWKNNVLTIHARPMV